MSATIHDLGKAREDRTATKRASAQAARRETGRRVGRFASKACLAIGGGLLVAVRAAAFTVMLVLRRPAMLVLALATVALLICGPASYFIRSEAPDRLLIAGVCFVLGLVLAYLRHAYDAMMYAVRPAAIRVKSADDVEAASAS